MIFTPNCPFCGERMIFTRDEPNRSIIECPSETDNGNSHYNWFASSFKMFTTNKAFHAYYFAETFIIGNYRITNKVDSADNQNHKLHIECGIYKLLPEPPAGTDYKVGAGLICLVPGVRIPPTVSEKKIQTYITFS